MTEIEKCVCGGGASLAWQGTVEMESDRGDVAVVSFVSVGCHECGRRGVEICFESSESESEAAAQKAAESWNHEQRGLRLLRELGAELFHSLSFESYDEDKQSKDAAHKLALRISAWAEEGDRE